MDLRIWMYLGSIGRLINNEGNRHNGLAMVCSFVQTIYAGMSQKRLDSWMAKNVILRCPVNELDVCAQIESLHGHVHCTASREGCTPSRGGNRPSKVVTHHHGLVETIKGWIETIRNW